MVAFAALTLVVFCAGFAILCSVALWHGEQWATVYSAVSFLQRPVRATRWRPLWVGPVRFAKRLLIALVVNASDFDPTSLPLSVFVALLCLLLVQVRLRGAIVSI